MTQRGQFTQFGTFILFLPFIFLLAACGNSDDSTSTSSPGTTSTQAAAADPNAVATMPAPAGNFTAVGQQSALTNTTNLTSTQSTTATTSIINLDVGVRAYDKNKCADCHGPKGEGIEGQGKAIAGTALSLEDFDKVLRTGGGLGNDHIFGRSAVSPTGMEALHAYVQSLK
jgi:mono/diheme cytochrome c family protein